MHRPPEPALARIRPGHVYAWSGPAVLVVSTDGFTLDGITGWFFRQTRFLRDLRLELNGEAPFPCSLAEAAPDVLELTYVVPPVVKGGGGGSGSGASGSTHGLLYRDLDLRLRHRLSPASFTSELRLTNRWQEHARVELAWILGADYVTMDEAHFGHRDRAVSVAAMEEDGGVRFRSEDADLPLETVIWMEVERAYPSCRFANGRLEATLDLPRQMPVTVRLHVRAVDVANPIDEYGEARRVARVRSWRASAAHVHAPGDPPLLEMTERALTDLGSLALLEGEADEWLTPAAGVPLYLQLWGRDALTAAWQASTFDGGEMLGDVLRRLTRLQGRAFAPERDEEPGRILNQGHTDARARPPDEPLERTYADFASPFDFIIGLGYRWALTGDRREVAPHFGAAQRVLSWARTHGDRDGDGYLEYLTTSPEGPAHQGWKDSENAVVGADGEQVAPPIAPCEVQGYYYVSLQVMSVLSGVLGDASGARELWRQARSLKERFNRDFWMDDEGYLAFGLDAEKRQIRALTSNPGQCLATGIVSDAHVPRLVRRMFEPDLFSGWGVRTLSAKNPAFNPLDYHLGSVWPVENGTILFGLKRYGLTERVLQLAGGLYDLARLWPAGRIPECVGGYARGELAHPGAYPRANAPQTWNQSVFPILLQSLLGLVPFAPLGVLMIDPALPPWLPHVTVRGLRVGNARVDIRFERDADGEVDYEVLEVRGESNGSTHPLRVIRQPWVQSFSADLWGRGADVVETLRKGGVTWLRRSQIR